MESNLWRCDILPEVAYEKAHLGSYGTAAGVGCSDHCISVGNVPHSV